jgi:16S rRNA (guanine527-N7)-methyltransferase
MDTDAGAALRIFAEAVRTSEHNLVSRRARAELEDRHIPECVALAAMLPAADGDLLDVGSGGGFPGLVIAAVRPDLRVTLLEATGKKAEFLAETASAMGVRVRVLHGRAEDLVSQHARSFDLVTARAVAPLERLLPITLPFLRGDGLLYAVKGDRWAEELQASLPTLQRMRARILSTPDDVHSGDGSATAHAPKTVIIAPTS